MGVGDFKLLHGQLIVVGFRNKHSGGPIIVRNSLEGWLVCCLWIEDVVWGEFIDQHILHFLLSEVVKLVLLRIGSEALLALVEEKFQGSQGGVVCAFKGGGGHFLVCHLLRVEYHVRLLLCLCQAKDGFVVGVELVG